MKEARGGKKFRCVEYGIVASTALQSLNFKARVLGLKTADVETKKYGAGHVLAEVWMPQFNKWVLIDGQFNLMPILENVPLNAVEFQQAISENKNYKLIDINELKTIQIYHKVIYNDYIKILEKDKLVDCYYYFINSKTNKYRNMLKKKNIMLNYVFIKKMAALENLVLDIKIKQFYQYGYYQ